SFFLFFFNLPSLSLFYSLSLHDALPISVVVFDRSAVVVFERSAVVASAHCPGRASAVAGLAAVRPSGAPGPAWSADPEVPAGASDRKSTRLNSSHQIISYAVFCLKNKHY